MKSYKSLLFTAAVSLMFAACGDDSGSNASTDEPSSSSVAKAKSSSSKAKSSSSAKVKSSSSTKAKSSSATAKSSSSVKAKSSSSAKVSSSSVKATSSSAKAEEQKYVLSFLTETSQFYGVTLLSEDQTKAVKNFAEAPISGSVGYFNKSVYTLAADDAANSTLSRFEYKDGKVASKASATAKFTGTQAIVMKFVNENKMYVNQALGDAITALDPKTLKTTATIDLSKYIDVENGALGTVPGSAVIRDGKLYVSLNQFVDFQYAIAGPRGCVAIIDISTDKVDKVIYTDKVAALGGMDDMNQTASFVDEKGDIYFYANASYSFVEGYQEGWVRIKKGETEFDTSWVFRMHDAAYDGKKSNTNSLMVGGTYIGNGQFFGFFGNFADPNNFNNYEWNFVVVDVYKKTIKKIDLSPTIPWFAPSIHLDADGKSVLVGHADSKGGAIYRYDIASGKVKKEMDVKTGTAYYIVPIKD